MKKRIAAITVLTLAVAMLAAGCAPKAGSDTPNMYVTSAPSAQEKGAAKDPESSGASEDPVTGSEESEAHNEDVTAQDLAPAAKELKKIVADKDLEALAGMCDYPLYVDGEEVADEESLLKMDAKDIFTDDLVKSVSDADPDSLEIFGAGAALGDTCALFINEISGKYLVTSITLG